MTHLHWVIAFLLFLFCRQPGERLPDVTGEVEGAEGTDRAVPAQLDGAGDPGGDVRCRFRPAAPGTDVLGQRLGGHGPGGMGRDGDELLCQRQQQRQHLIHVLVGHDAEQEDELLPRETPGAITVFLLLQGVLYGFGRWWVMYLYVWYLLALLAWLLRRMDYAFFWAVLSGLYGLCFGGLCAAVYLFAKTPAFALSWWLSGLSYDALHGVGNFVLMLLLYRPLRRALQMAKKQLRV